MSFILGNEAREDAKKSLKALRAYTLKEYEDSLLRPAEKSEDSSKVPSAREPVLLVLNTKIHLIQQKDFTPRIIPITHKLSKLGEKSIALIARDGSYRQSLMEKGSPTEDLFKSIISYSKAKSIGSRGGSLHRLFKEHDIILGDARIHKHLPDVLKAQFYAKNRKVPFKVLMALPVPGKKTHGKTDQSCEPKYVKAQLKSIVGNTYFIPPAGGTCITIVVGYTDWKVSELLTNIDDVMSYLIEEKHRPVGGLLRSVENLHSVLIRTNHSVALPVLKKKEEKKGGSEEESMDV